MPSWDERIAAADNVVLKAQKAVSRADDRGEAAEDEADGKQVRVERAMKDLRAAPSASSELPIAQFQKVANRRRRRASWSAAARRHKRSGKTLCLPRKMRRSRPCVRG